MNVDLQVPFHRPSIGREEIEEVVRTLESGWLTSGPRTARFEEEFRAYVGARQAVAVNSCTAGLHLALAALKIGPGDEVITTPLTFCATVNVILHVGGTPVLADVGADGNIDPASVAMRITDKTRAIIPVHLAGLPCEMDTLWKLARQHWVFVIEDAAHAVGSRYRGRPIGAEHSGIGRCSDAVAFSFHPTKNLTTGEGGMVTTHCESIGETIRLLCLHGISKNAWNRYTDRGHWYYEVLQSGFKYNLPDIQAAIGIHQLRKLEGFLAVRERYARIYNEILAEVEEVELPPDNRHCRHAWHLYMLRLNLDRLEINRDEFIQALREQGVGTSVHFIPIFLHPFFAPYAGRFENQCPRAGALYPRLISLPLYPAMTEAQLEYAAEAVKQVARKARKHKPVAVGAVVGRA
jgi:dTDP-4-amino-4,6-dideoxygalactose transaminase